MFQIVTFCMIPGRFAHYCEKLLEKNFKWHKSVLINHIPETKLIQQQRNSENTVTLSELVLRQKLPSRIFMNLSYHILLITDFRTSYGRSWIPVCFFVVEYGEGLKVKSHKPIYLQQLKQFQILYSNVIFYYSYSLCNLDSFIPERQ